MPYQRDTLTTLRQSIRADIAARLPGVDPFVRRSPFGVIADVFAKLQNDQFGYLDWQARQDVPVTAQDEYLDAWAALKGVARKSPAAAFGAATIALAIPGRTVSSGVVLTRSDGALYTVTTGATIADDGTATLALSAVTLGAAGNMDPGGSLSFETPIAGIPDTVTVTAMGGGADIEADDAERGRMLAGFRAPPHGGDASDYIEWVLNLVPAATRAWVVPNGMGAGTVSIYFMEDVARAGDGGFPQGTDGVPTNEARGIPTATGDQLIVANTLYPVRPVTALVYVFAPVGDPLNVTLAEVPVDTAIRNGITAAVAGFLLREASLGGSVDATMSPGGTLRVSHLEDAIAAVPGLDHFVLQSPNADIVAGPGHLAIPGTITYL